VKNKNIGSLLGVGDRGQLNQDPSSRPARTIADALRKSLLSVQDTVPSRGRLSSVK
jgi:hypothetical protein